MNMARLAGLALLAITAGTTAALAQSRVPQLDVTSTCRPIAKDDFSMQIDTQRCHRSEYEARDQLSKDWGKYSVSDRSLCTQTATMAGFQSYVQLLTCLELQQDLVKGLPPADPNNALAGRRMQNRPVGLPNPDR